jgi:hypothetical protein
MLPCRRSGLASGRLLGEVRLYDWLDGCSPAVPGRVAMLARWPWQSCEAGRLQAAQSSARLVVGRRHHYVVPRDKAGLPLVLGVVGHHEGIVTLA